MENLQTYILRFLTLVLGLIGGYMVAYFKQKAENRAALEDSTNLTRIVEEVKSEFSSQLEATRSLFAGGLEGIKHQLALAADASRRYEDLKSSAYVDFCRSLSALAISQRSKDQKGELDATIAIVDAKIRIAVYGSAEVASLLGDFFMEHPHLGTPEAKQSFIQAISLMRKQTAGEDETVHPNVLSQLVFGQDLFDS